MNATLLTTLCSLCGNTVNLLRCSRCKVMFHCNREHQVAHNPTHKLDCKAIAKWRDIVDDGERKLRSHADKLFTSSVGRFWDFEEAGDYMSVRFSLIDALRGCQDTRFCGGAAGPRHGHAAAIPE